MQCHTFKELSMLLAHQSVYISTKQFNVFIMSLHFISKCLAVILIFLFCEI